MTTTIHSATDGHTPDGAARHPTTAAARAQFASSTRRRSRPSRSQFVLAAAAVLLLVFALSTTSIMFRPEGTPWSAWWPASGVAIGFASRLDRRRIWIAAGAIGAVSALASLINGREVPLALWGGLAVAAEVWIGVAILRSRADRSPRLDTAADLGRLFVSALVSSATVGVVGGLAVAALRGIDSYLPAVVASVPAHAVGVLVIAPLTLSRRRQSGSAGLGEAIGIWTFLAVILGVSFGLNVGLPIAFLASLPLTWGSARLAPRSALWMMVVVAIAVTTGSLLGRGPFAMGDLPADVSVLMVHLFNLSFAIFSLTLTVLTSQRRRLASTVLESATLFRTAFDFSPVGSAIILKTQTGPIVDQLNSAGRDLLGLSDNDTVLIGAQLSDESVAVLSEVVGRYGDAGEREWRGTITLRDGRSFQVMLSRLPSELESHGFAIQFFDITTEVRAKRAAMDDLARAGEVQRALLPKDLSPLVGYDVAGACVPAKIVGGDFYDWYRVDGGLAFTLGDVMGKGVGAGMIAATARAALRSARHDENPAVAVARAADTMTTEVADANSFLTLFHARLRAEDGAVSYVDAGHGLALIVRRDGIAHRIASTGLPIGIMPGSAWTSQHEVLNLGDTFIAVSDGVLDLYDGTLAALDHVADLARGADSASQLAALLSELALGLSEPQDDSTIVVIRRNV